MRIVMHGVLIIATSMTCLGLYCVWTAHWKAAAFVWNVVALCLWADRAYRLRPCACERTPSMPHLAE